jgi:hypothetical protein
MCNVGPCPCSEFRSVSIIDEQQCDVERQVSPGRKYAPEEEAMSDDTKTESVYERARKVLEALEWGFERSVIFAALNAGQAAEGYVRDLVEKCRINRERAEAAERERDALKARVKECEAALKAVSTDIAQDALEDPIGHDERKRAGWYRLFEGTMVGVRSALDPPKEGR